MKNQISASLSSPAARIRRFYAREFPDRAKDALLIALLAVFMFPLLFALLVSLKGDPNGLTYGTIPEMLTQGRLQFENYLFALSLLTGLVLNSLVICGIATIIATVISFLAAYALARFRFPGDDLFMIGLAGTQLIPAAAMYIPLYLLFLWIRRNAIIPMDGRLGAVIVYIGMAIPLAVWILRTFIRGVPTDIEEQAMLDGAGRLRTMWSIVFPVAAPGVFATAVYIFMVAWDEMIFGSLLHAGTLSATMRAQFGFFLTSVPFAAVVAFVSILPIAVLFFALQKRFITGLTGSSDDGRQATPVDDEEEADRPRNYRKIVWVLLPVVGFVLLILGNTHESLWADEAFTMALTAHNPVDIWRITSADVHPPLFYYMLWAFRSIFGSSVFVARTFSALGTLGTILLGVGPLRRAIGDRAALIFSVFVIATPVLLAYSQDVRMYSWALCFVTGMAIYLFLAIRDSRRRDWIMASLFTAAAMYTHLYSLLAAFFLALAALGYLLLRDRRKLKAFLPAMAVPALLFLPWLFTLIQQSRKIAGSFWIPEVTDAVVTDTLAYSFGLKFFTTTFSTITAYLIYGVILVGLFFLWRKSAGRGLLALSVFGCAATFITAVVVSRTVRPILIGRYIIPLIGLLLIAAAYSISRWRAGAVRTMCVLLLILQVPSLGEIYQDAFNGPMDTVAQFLTPNLGPDDVIVHFEEHNAGTFSVYFPDRIQYLYKPAGSVIYTNMDAYSNLRVVTSLTDIPVGKGRIWLTLRVGDNTNRAAYLQAAQYFGIPVFPASTPNQDLNAINLYPSTAIFTLPWSWYGVVIQQSADPVTGGFVTF